MRRAMGILIVKLSVKNLFPTAQPWESCMTHMIGQLARRGRNFRNLRQDRNYSYDQIASMLRCRVSEIVAYENGNSSEKYPDALTKLASLHLKWEMEKFNDITVLAQKRR
jgi:hypothetical protein